MAEPSRLRKVFWRNLEEKEYATRHFVKVLLSGLHWDCHWKDISLSWKCSLPISQLWGSIRSSITWQKSTIAGGRLRIRSYECLQGPAWGRVLFIPKAMKPGLPMCQD